MSLRVIAIGNKNLARRIARSLSGSNIEFAGNIEVPQNLDLLQINKFDLVLVDAYINNLESTCYRITWLYHTPIALVIKGTQDDWDLLRDLDVDGFIPEEARNIDLEAHFTAISHRSSHKFTKIKALIIEDDGQIQEALRLSFEIYWPEAEIAFASDGESGIKLAKNTTFDIILLDLVLPDISGYEVLSRIRLFSRTPIIIVTATRNPEDVKRSMSLGANDFILKPFRQLELMSRIRQQVNLAASLN